MPAKLVAMALAVAATSASLLSARQQRVDIAYEMARLQQRMVEHDETLWRLRMEIAHRTHPDQVQRMVATLDPMSPVLIDWCPPMLPGDGRLALTPQAAVAGSETQ
ncbi:MAG: hypothetical protein EA376_12395 [Phycisphaeraceae bacterium]|nr:MAG: hypothetical protein EA376_12395 [Phycisphaeraceae bacterium]